MILKAHGKINLSLDITNRRDNGYHDVAMVMQSVELCDIISVKMNNSGLITVKTDNPAIPDGEKNLAYKACKLMKDTFSLDFGFDIFIEKHIPLSGGMAGGSTDAASVIRAVNELCGLRLTEEKMMKIGIKLGADIPFCIHRKPSFCEGLGEVITPIKGLSENIYILLVNPNEEISTKNVYELFDDSPRYNSVDNASLIDALSKDDIILASKYMKNVLEPISSSLCEKISDIIKKMDNLGAIKSMMSGSGATCFGIFKSKPDIKKVNEAFDGYYYSLTKPVN